MRRVTVLLAVCLALCAPLPLHAAGAADAMLVQANAALASGQYPAAQTLASSGLAETGLEPVTQSRLLVVRGLAHPALGASSEALVDFTTALQGSGLVGEERARALFARGLSLDVQARHDLAINDYTAALNIVPRAPWALNNRANVYRRQGRFAEARRDYAAALEAGTPDPQYPYYGLGQIAEAQNDTQAARSFYSQALTADPTFVLARTRLQALGAPVEGFGGLPVDTGIIVLRPPGQRAPDAPIILTPPDSRPQASQPSRAAAPAAAMVRVAQPVPPL